MNSKTFEKGSFVITNQTMHLFGTTIVLSNIDSMDFITYKKHSLFSGFKEWVIGLIITAVISGIWINLTWIFTIYLFTIIPLIAYNIYEHRNQYFGLEIRTNRRTIYLKSDNSIFIHKIHDAINTAVNSKNANYTINLDSHDIVNNGIINKGNNNHNEVKNDH